eukprot:jgi/Tetstr1/438211/TSEL_026810.t1
MVGSNKALGNAAKPVANGHLAGNGNGGHDSRKKSKAANMSKRNRGDDAPPVATNGRHTNNGKRQKSSDGKQKATRRWGEMSAQAAAEMQVGEAEMRHRHGKMWPCDSHQRHPKAPDGLTWLRVSA